MGLLDRMIGRNVEKYLSSMLASGQANAEFSNLVFDAARVYAQNNGAKYYADMPDSIGFDKKFGGKNYNVFFMRGRGGRGTSEKFLSRPCRRYLNRHSSDPFGWINRKSPLLSKTLYGFVRGRSDWIWRRVGMDVTSES